MPIEAVVEGVAEEVADNLEELAVATRRINPSSVGGLVIGLAIGIGAGFYFGHRWNTEKIRAEAFKESEAEVDKIREVYREGVRVVIDEAKPTLDEAVADAGYSHVAPPRPLRAPVPVREQPIQDIPFEGPEHLVRDGDWDYAEELQKRQGRDAYVIHQNERGETDTPYSNVVYTYYAEDDVLVDDEDGHPLPHADIIVGQDNLRFGEGTDDEDVVFVRNDRLQTEMEICRKHASFEEEVLGLDGNESA